MRLPIFPLHVVLFPGRPLPLHLFEARYRRMLDDCVNGDRRFGVVAIKAGLETDKEPDTYDVGTVAEIEDVTELADGRFDIRVRGVDRFRIEQLYQGDPYPSASVACIPNGHAGDADHDNAQMLRKMLVPYLKLLGAPDELLAHVPHEPDELAYLAASAVQADLREQQALLELETTTVRLQATLAALRRETGLIRHFGTVASLRPPDPQGAELN